MIKEKIFQSWVSITGLSDIDKNTTLFDLGVDSIKIIELTEELFKQFHVRLSWSDFNITTTYNEMEVCIINAQ